MADKKQPAPFRDHGLFFQPVGGESDRHGQRAIRENRGYPERRRLLYGARARANLDHPADRGRNKSFCQRSAGGYDPANGYRIDIFNKHSLSQKISRWSCDMRMGAKSGRSR